MEFKKVKQLLEENFASISASNHLFEVDIDNDYLLNLYALKTAMLLDDVIVRIRDHSIGVLLVNISERPKAIFTKKMLEDAVHKALNKEANDSNINSLMHTSGDFDPDLIAKIDIVRYIFKAKEDEAAVRKDTDVKAAKKQHILEAIAQKEESALHNMSKDELMKMLNELG